MREELCTLGYYIAQNPQWRFPVWEVLCGRVSGNPLCEGGDVELCAQTSKHIIVFAFDPLTLTLSLSLSYLPYIDSYCHIIYMLGLFVCHTCVNQESFI